MIDTLPHYIANSLPSVEQFRQDPGFRFTTHPNLEQKVNQWGTLERYMGNTVVFRLRPEVQAVLAELQQDLYRSCKHLLCKTQLDPAQFHMTLHDLANGPVEEKTRVWMAETEPKARELVRQLKETYTQPMLFRGTYLFNMMNTSVVLGLAPMFGCEAQLDEMYQAFHAVVPLPYALTPHVTLAYFRPGSYTEAELEPLREQLKAVNLTFSVRMQELEFQVFGHMNCYQTIE